MWNIRVVCSMNTSKTIAVTIVLMPMRASKGSTRLKIVARTGEDQRTACVKDGTSASLETSGEKTDDICS